MINNLIVPIAADKAEYSQSMPYLFGLGEDGIMICIKSILGLNIECFHQIYFTILKKHDEAYFVSESLLMQCKRLNILNVKIVILEQETQDQVDTVYQTILNENINGSIYIKDADSYFESRINTTNGVAIFPIEELELLDPRNKSYVAIDDMYYITNIIEKSVIGHYISAGGYLFDSSAEFCEYACRLRQYGKLYISHIIYAMLLDKKMFRPMMVKNYKDRGTKKMTKI
ncbi:MAG: hypothetical protein SNJ29_06555 [Rikenellaceae bacterium]